MVVTLEKSFVNYKAPTQLLISFHPFSKREYYILYSIDFHQISLLEQFECIQKIPILNESINLCYRHFMYIHFYKPNTYIVFEILSTSRSLNSFV